MAACAVICLAGAQSPPVDALSARLTRAVLENQPDLVGELLNQGTSPRMEVPYGNILMLAARNGRAQIVKILLERGAEISRTNADGVSPLMFAAMAGSVPTAQLLIEKGADVNAANRWGATPLIVAALNGKPEVAALLIEKGANVNARDLSGSTSLIRAIRRGHPAVARLLVSKGADPRVKDNIGADALSLARSLGPPLLIDMLLAKSGEAPPVAPVDRQLLQAIEAGKASLVKEALAAGANPDVRSDAGVPVLLNASYYGRIDIMKALISKGAKVNAANWGGVTPLIFAAQQGRSAAVELLLAHGADAEAKDEGGGNALINAVTHGQAAIASRLLGQGANVNSANREGITPLMVAADKGHVYVARELLSNGAFVNATSEVGWSALMFAARGGKRGAVQLLLSKGADATLEAGGRSASAIAERAGHKDLAELIRSAPLTQSEPVVNAGVSDIDRPYAVLHVLTAQEVEQPSRDPGRKWPEREPLDQRVVARLQRSLEARARELGADGIIIQSGQTTNDVSGGMDWKYHLGVGLLIAAQIEAKRPPDFRSPRIPGFTGPQLLAAVIQMNGGVPEPDEARVERKHTMVAYAVAYEKQGGHRPPAPDELKHWLQAQRSDAIGPYRKYLARFPEGSFAGLAKVKLSKVATANVWVYRKDSFRPAVFVNGSPVLRLGGGRYALLQLDPGTTVFAAGDETSRSVTLDLKAGEEYFLRSHVAWAGGERIEVEDEQKAGPEMKKLRPADLQWVRDPSCVRLTDYVN